ncbi:MAG TPA: imidazolonepropionase [Symbiobacteriaceae bacterium]|nr:imidazolonepropionase [Symbiobacteriaceae bacterium]
MVDAVLVGASELVTMAGGVRQGQALGEPGVIARGALAVRDGKIVAVGSEAEIRQLAGPQTQVIDAGGRAVIPGFVDPHTHLCWGGDRADEFAQRLAGATYQEIAARGGGILSTVRATRSASEADLIQSGRRRLNALAASGTTTVEVKSGYTLNLEGELKQLRAIQAMAAGHPLDVVSTFMGAHEFPPEYRENREGFVDLLCQEMIPAVAASGLARFCDVFTETGVFTPDQTRRILAAGKAHGLLPKVHADELSDLGGGAVAAELGAISADHLLYANDDSLAAMAKAGTVAVCLPGTAFCLMNVPYAPARRMVELGCTVALASDYNPGSCPVYKIPFLIALACMNLKLTIEEALAAATINAAAAIGLQDQVGSLEVGKQADFLLLDLPSYRHLPYQIGQGGIHAVYKRGALIARDGLALIS